jgi:hypothetical protein
MRAYEAGTEECASTAYDRPVSHDSADLIWTERTAVSAVHQRRKGS